MNAIQRILVAVDASPCSAAAADLAARLVRQLDGSVELMTVIDVSAVADAGGDASARQYQVEKLREEARDRLWQFAGRHLPDADEIHAHVLDGGSNPPDVAAAVTGAAEAWNCDLIVLGTHGKTGLEHLILGSVAEKIVRTSRVPVLTVRAPGAAA
jgi:nucleotide-binding universal stress UspA family protein